MVLEDPVRDERGSTEVEQGVDTLHGSWSVTRTVAVKSNTRGTSFAKVSSFQLSGWILGPAEMQAGCVFQTHLVVRSGRRKEIVSSAHTPIVARSFLTSIEIPFFYVSPVECQKNNK